MTWWPAPGRAGQLGSPVLGPLGWLLGTVSLGGAVLLVPAAVTAGSSEVLNVLVGAVLVLAVLAAGPALLLGRRLPPVMLFALALLAYWCVAVGLAVVGLALAGAEWVRAPWLGGAVLLCTLTGVTGLVRGLTQVRAPVYDVDLPVNSPGEK